MSLVIKTYAVAFMTYFENELTIELVNADSITEAVFKHSKIVESIKEGYVEGFPTELDEIKEEFLDMDCLVDVKEVS